MQTSESNSGSEEAKMSLLQSGAEMAMTGGASAVLGATLSLVGKGVNIMQENKKLSHARSLEELQVLTQSMNDANARGGQNTPGEWVRRFMVIALFVFVFVVLPTCGVIGYFTDVDFGSTFVYMAEAPRKFFGLFGGGTEMKAVPITGVPIFRTFVEMGYLMGAFYFGSSRIK